LAYRKRNVTYQLPKIGEFWGIRVPARFPGFSDEAWNLRLLSKG